jgi:pimeloyl-ACP methyl ester carboxylesterase
MQKKKRKGRWFRRILRTIISLICFLILACFLFDHYVQFRKSDEELNKFFKENRIPAVIHYYSSQGRAIRYVSLGNDSLPTLLMIHGSPGSMSRYTNRFADSILLKNFRMYAVDRPGYGYSGFGDPEPSIQKQSEIIKLILDSLHKVTHPVIILGSSYGAPIACRLAMDHPELVDGLVLTAPALAPGKEEVFWIAPFIEHWYIRWFIPRIFKSANTEKLHHKEELEKMLPYWKNIHVPVMYLQGAKDRLVDTSNAGFAKQQLINAPFISFYFFPERRHYLSRREWPVIKNHIFKMYEMLKKK